MSIGVQNYENSWQAAADHADLNGFVWIADSAPSQSSGPLAGMVLGVKDNIHVAGMPNVAGTAALTDFVPEEDATAVNRLKNAGALMLGKTNMHELAYGVTGINHFCGPTKNPFDTSRFAGGSSGGSAAVVAAGIVTAALGTDTGGSMRIPAALCGVIGFRPTTGRYPMEGVTPVSHTRDTIGPMARRIDDIIQIDKVITQSNKEAVAADISKLRLGIARDPFFRNLDSEVERVTANALQTLANNGVTLIEADMPGLVSLNDQASFPIALYETLPSLEKYLAQYCPQISMASLIQHIESPDVKAMFEEMTSDGAIPKTVYDDAMNIHRPKMQELYNQYFEQHSVDAMVFPTTILPAGPIAGTIDMINHNDQDEPVFPIYVQNTDPGSLLGLPGITMPAGLTKDGLPVGMALDGAKGQDEKILSIALAIENLLGPSPQPHNI